MAGETEKVAGKYWSQAVICSTAPWYRAKHGFVY